jgi:heterodisulfide reductase subunit C
MEKNGEMVTIYVMGKKHKVPYDLTIMKAMEYAGHQFRRGAGCRGGYCGACATLYRVKGSYKLEGALACQKIVEAGMYIAQIPFNPAEKKTYDIEKVRPSANTMLEYYPELSRCLACNTCTKACPQDLDVMDYVQASLRGDIPQAARLSFDCISCGLCAVRCPAEIVPYNVATLARRLNAKYVDGLSEHVLERVKEVEDGVYDEDIDVMMKASKEELAKMYNSREIDIVE